jgi:hypothetical protein
MRTPGELDHYEILEIDRDADSIEVERAYRLVRATFASDSLATYSIFDDDDSAVMQDRLELAYGVLSDPEARAEYDRSLGAPMLPEQLEEDEESEFLEIKLDLEAEPEHSGALSGTPVFEESLEEDGEPWGGARLRRNRLQRGIELDEIARVTKVNPTYLRFIEEDHFAGLPAPVYVRGFVTAYARCLGLDPTQILPEYLDRVEGTGGQASPSGLFGAPRRRG